MSVSRQVPVRPAAGTITRQAICKWCGSSIVAEQTGDWKHRDGVDLWGFGSTTCSTEAGCG